MSGQRSGPPDCFDVAAVDSRSTATTGIRRRRNGRYPRLGCCQTIGSDRGALRTLEKEDARIQSQLLELSKIVLGLSNDVHEMLGEMRSIEKRFDDRDRLLEATIRLRIAEEMQKIRAELLEKGTRKDGTSGGR